MVRKPRVGAFAAVDFEPGLRQRSVTTLVLTGLSTSGVVLSTLRHAADLDYRIVVLSDAVGDPDPDAHRVLVENVFPKQAYVTTVDALPAPVRELSRAAPALIDPEPLLAGGDEIAGAQLTAGDAGAVDPGAVARAEVGHDPVAVAEGQRRVPARDGLIGERDVARRAAPEQQLGGRCRTSPGRRSAARAERPASQPGPASTDPQHPAVQPVGATARPGGAG